MSGDLAALRHALHRRPELSGQEQDTAVRMAAEMAGADRVVAGLGGHGVAAVIEGAAPGPTVLLRAELGALPIEEGATPLRSEVPGVAHLCGHDGHMGMLVGAARALMRRRPARGRVVILFQPAEEDGSGARAVAADPRFATLRPNWAFALHNKPGQPLGAVAVRPGPTTCASRGLRVALAGRTAHASEPERGLSPMGAILRLLPALARLGPGGAPGEPGYALSTVTHARLGAPAFGVAPGEGEILCTLRAVTDAEVDGLAARAEALAREEAARAGLEASLAWHDVFAATHATTASASSMPAPTSDAPFGPRARGPRHEPCRSTRLLPLGMRCAVARQHSEIALQGSAHRCSA